MKLFESVSLIFTMAMQPSGAAVQQQLFERVLTFPDDAYRYLWEVLLVVSYLLRLAFGLYSLVIEIFDTVLLAWQENLLEPTVKVVLSYAPIPSPYG